MKKVFDQTVRDLKREVNKKVLKVPSIEQKVLDITSNEPWGPHGSIMADIAQATRNYHEYQMIMGVLWKRLNDTGKNWRHVYKALTVLEYLVGHGSERVIDDLREHAYQISTLKDFQYIDSRGKDQGQNVRKKSHALVTLLNDKERIREARQKAAANKDKYRSAASSGGYYRSSPYGGDQFDDDRYGYGSRYGGRDDERNVYGRDRDWDRDRYRDREDERNSYGRDNGERYSYGRDSGERYGRDGDHYRDDEFGGERDHDEGRHGSRRGENAYDDSERRRNSDYSTSEDRYERKQAGGMEAPPSYEEAVNDSVHPDERDRPSIQGTVNATSQAAVKSPPQDASAFSENATTSKAQPLEEFDDFDPRNSFAAAATSAPFSNSENDLFASPPEMLALPAPSTVPPQTSVSETNLTADLFGNDTFTSHPAGHASHTSFTAAPSSAGITHAVPASDPQVQNQNPFGDPPFKASFSANEDPNAAQRHDLSSTLSSFSVENSQSQSITSTAPSFNVTPNGQASVSPDSLQPNPLNPFETVTQLTIPQPTTIQPIQSSNPADAFQTQLPTYTMTQPLQQTQTQAKEVHLPVPNQMQSQALAFDTGFIQPRSSTSSTSSSRTPEEVTPQGASVIPSATTNKASQHKNDKFEPKSGIWADTLSRGLVDLNISGPKINPLADIGIDFDSINRKEKRREEKSSAASLLSNNQPMGKAMGSGSGLGRAGGPVMSGTPNTMVSSMGSYGMGMGAGAGGGAGAGTEMGAGAGAGMGMNVGVGMGTGAGMGRGAGAGMGMGMSPAMGMNAPMGVNPGMGMRPSMGVQPMAGTGMGMNPMMGGYSGMGTGMNPTMGGYVPQQQPGFR
eukprot:TRINITY_DN622_c0_g1_i1.p1 TRINITY_DN622_c0_g1~~TRINITY_DN622_c0_g1_i1.p1  ORF type:complete len:851 (+),score=223.18 TRINITY_DN622_c0_g1_i1:431-2983(+)